MDDLITYINNNKNLEVIGQTSDCTDNAQTVEMHREFVIFKHLKHTDNRYFISIINDHEGYDVHLDCNLGIIGTQYEPDCTTKDAMLVDLKKMIKEIGKMKKNYTMMNCTIDEINQIFKYFYQLCNIPITEYPIRGLSINAYKSN